MAWTRDDVEELRQGIQEVENLWDEEQQHGFAEVPKDAHYGKGHPSKKAERITHKHTRWVPALRQKRESKRATRPVA